MAHTDKVKLMDSGTVLFSAGSPEAARSAVRDLLSAQGILTETAPGHYCADCSNGLFYSIVEATVEETSLPGRYAVAFREGNRCRLALNPFPSRKAFRRMEGIKHALSGETQKNSL